jgi:hypothetical protein
MVVPVATFVLGTLLLVGGLVTTHEQLVVGVVIGVTGALTMAGTFTVAFRRFQRNWSLIVH